MITIPDYSLKTVFDTTLYFDIPLGLQGESMVELPPNVTNVEASYQTINWQYSGDGIESNISTNTTQAEVIPGANKGQYSITLPSSKTPIGYLVTWEWINNNANESYQIGYIARNYMPHYQQLGQPFKKMCQSVLNEWCMLHDNSYGNSKPHEAENLQIHFSLDDVAEAMQVSSMIFQTSISVPTHYSLTNQNPFPIQEFGGILYTATLRELTHRVLIGYIENPVITGDVKYADRKEYYNKWREEFDRLDKQMIPLQAIYQRRHITFAGAIVQGNGGMFASGSFGLLTNQQLNATYQGQYVNGYMTIPIQYNPNAN